MKSVRDTMLELGKQLKRAKNTQPVKSGSLQLMELEHHNCTGPCCRPDLWAVGIKGSRPSDEAVKPNDFVMRVSMKFPLRPGEPVRLRPDEKLVTIETKSATKTRQR